MSNSTRQKDDDLLSKIALEGASSNNKAKKKKVLNKPSQDTYPSTTINDLLDVKKNEKTDPITSRVPRYVHEYYESLAQEKGVSLSKLCGTILKNLADRSMNN